MTNQPNESQNQGVPEDANDHDQCTEDDDSVDLEPSSASDVGTRQVTTTSNAPRDAWSMRASELAEWTLRQLVNRTDVYGRYLPLDRREEDRSNNYTAPRKENRIDGVLTKEIIERHYCGQDQGDLIGLHAIGKDNMSRWCVVDIDQHGDGDSSTAEGNLAAARGWYERLHGMGSKPLLLDSNGAGGLHLLVVFSEPVPSQRVFDFGRWLVSDYQNQGFSSVPEVFPKQPNVNARRPYGSWWRSPGRHHTREHRTRVWCGDDWVEGHQAVDAILATEGDSPELIPADLHVRVSGRVGTGTRSPSSPYGAEHWMELLCGREPGGRHESLLQLAGHLLGKGVHPQVVEELCVCWNERNTPPKPEDAIRRTVQDLVQRDAVADTSRKPTTRTYKI